MSEQRYLILDYETRSEIELKKVGSYEYANHPTTQILCASWRVGTRKELRNQIDAKLSWNSRSALSLMPCPYDADIWSPAFKDTGSGARLAELIANPDLKIVAHNALFEQVITRFVLPRHVWCNDYVKSLPHDRWECTASFAAALALPRNLEGACAALSLPIQKDMDGRRLILKYCKPRKPSKNNPAKWFQSARDLRRIMLYCQNDVDAETMLFLTVPPLTPDERKVWLLDQQINFRGFQADRKLVKAALTHIAEETAHLNKETTRITNGKPGSTTQRDAVLKWLHGKGVFLPDLRAKTVSDAISAGLVEGEPKRLLEIRQSISKVSTKKYHAFDARSRTDGRVRDILVYHTASTGRWGGAGVQPQNFPRGTIDDTTLAADILRSSDLEFVRLVYGNPMGVLSSCLRSVITAPKGKELFCADYAAIEARVLFWVAKHSSGLKSFFENRPVYEEMASVIFNVDLTELIALVQIEDASAKLKRQVGKQAFLGCGYGMGWKKFLLTCKFFGIEVDEEIAQTAVSAYRSYHEPVVKLWGSLERAAIAAVKRKGTRFKINRTSWWVECLPGSKLEFLWCELPSGRRLAYPFPTIKYELTPWDEKRPVLYHWGVDPLTRKWVCAGTYGGKLTENVVSAISRDLMAGAMLRVAKSGYDLILTVHDEILAERQRGVSSLENFTGLMSQLPPWAEGCPVAVKGWTGPRYHK
jgi:DNA polymerase